MKFLFLGLGIFLSIAAFFVYQYGEPVWERAFEHQKWYEIEADVNSYLIEKNPYSQYSVVIKVSYSYLVQSYRYQGSDVYPARNLHKSKAEEFIKNLPKKLRVYVNPSSHSQSLLKKESLLRGIAVLIGLILLILMGTSLFILTYFYKY